MARNDSGSNGFDAEGIGRADLIGAVLALAWIVIVGLLFWLLPSPDVSRDAFQTVLILVAVFMPLALIWVAVSSARALHVQSARLDAAIHKLRKVHQAELVAQAEAIATLQQAAASPTETPAPAPAPQVQQPDAGPTRFASRREVSRLIVPQAAPQMPADQPSLALDTAALDERPPLSRADMIRALHFPDDENDTEGFAALRRALRDRGARKLVQASQDVLTLLSQDGIYMDDLRTEPVSAELWRRFAKGERGAAIAKLGTVRDGDTLDVVVMRMREDAIFRDAAHHFLRQFDQMLVIFEGQATDNDILAMSETRTARAFVLLGRATGTFR